jgi:hypothetical protein
MPWLILLGSGGRELHRVFYSTRGRAHSALSLLRSQLDALHAGRSASRDLLLLADQAGEEGFRLLAAGVLRARVDESDLPPSPPPAEPAGYDHAARAAGEHLDP